MPFPKKTTATKNAHSLRVRFASILWRKIMGVRASESAIMHGFQAFYYELLRQKEKALSLYFVTKPLSGPDAIEEEKQKTSQKQLEIEGAIVTFQKKIISTIEDITNMIMSKSRLPHVLIADVKYIMSVLADEVFINLRWEGAPYWRFTLLEKQIFQTEVAGDRFFALLDEMIANYNSNNEEVLFIYLMALSLGFKGRYRDCEDSDTQILWYKDRLYSMLHTKPSRLFYPGRTQMIESCYEFTNTEHNDSQLPDVKFWSWCVIGVLFVYIIVSYGIWHNITDEINNVLSKIAEQAKSGLLV
ncbi:MAG: DotU family type IV/VI secretion system protein [Holosporales bacterium]|jgi:type IV/VI secretion system ImpK/VasF family protein|nr:DotU family type IV/VI secretion system protein [Holosporales bacterium]